jgi:hypothetical protein
MVRLIDYEQLRYLVSRLLVEVVCPKCGRIIISTVPEAQLTLIFGCDFCADIETSSLLSFESLSTGNTGEVVETFTG